jgi:hypothetical protein
MIEVVVRWVNRLGYSVWKRSCVDIKKVSGGRDEAAHEKENSQK